MDNIKIEAAQELNPEELKDVTVFENRPDISMHMPALANLALHSHFILELGTANGNGSTRAFTAGMRRNEHEDRLFISVDFADPLIDEQEKPDLPFWWYVIGDTTKKETVETVKKICKDRLADLIFIDTEHSYDQMKLELPIWKELASPNALWLFHDTYMNGEYNPMTDAIKEFAEANPEWEYFDLSKESNGIGMLAPKKAAGEKESFETHA